MIETILTVLGLGVFYFFVGFVVIAIIFYINSR